MEAVSLDSRASGKVSRHLVTVATHFRREDINKNETSPNDVFSGFLSPPPCSDCFPPYFANPVQQTSHNLPDGYHTMTQKVVFLLISISKKNRLGRGGDTPPEPRGGNSSAHPHQCVMINCSLRMRLVFKETKRADPASDIRSTSTGFPNSNTFEPAFSRSSPGVPPG